ncbi:MAG TPA: hypothetical protein VFM18_19940, partial [Methanosarcina sp.]|nr:hypothetical protein [Methanosarcina sp.]
MKTGQIILIGFLIRAIVSFWNGFYGPSLGAENDAASFHLAALEYGQIQAFYKTQITQVYPFILGTLYNLISDSLFFGSILSSIAWLTSAAFLLKTCETLNIKSERKIAFIIFSLYPSSVMFTSVTLREAYQLLSVTCAIYAIIKIYYKNGFSYWAALVLSVIGMGALHGGLLVFGVYLLV